MFFSKTSTYFFSSLSTKNSNFFLNQLESYLLSQSYPSYRFHQVTQAIFKEKNLDFKGISSLPLSLREELSSKFGSYLKPAIIKSTKADQTEKVLFKLKDGNKVEAVSMDFHNAHRHWQSLCLSSQVGCALACSFCSTGAIGYKRNMSIDEILGQVFYFSSPERSINSISFMGMGEPLLNPNIFPTIEILTDKNLFNFSPRRISISTVGILPSLEKLVKGFPQVNISFSLHSPFEEERKKLMPIAKSYSSVDVINLLDDHIAQYRRKIFIAYLMIQGVNDTENHLNGLIEFIKLRKNKNYYHINLIPYHSTLLSNSQAQKFVTSSKKNIHYFFAQLKKEDIHVTIRQSFGENIQAACGQLYGDYESLRKST